MGVTTSGGAAALGKSVDHEMRRQTSAMHQLLAILAATTLLAPSIGVAQTRGSSPAMDQPVHPHSHGVPHNHGSPSSHNVGPAGNTYDLRWLDAMVLHHTGALRMSEFVFDVGAPGVGALAKAIWSDQAQEIKAMGQWRKAWYPEAPVAPVTWRPGGDPDAMKDLIPMSPDQIQGMQMMGATPTRSNRITWFLEGMIQHHTGALLMAHDALEKSTNPTIRRLARSIIVTQRQEIIKLRRMLQGDTLNQQASAPLDHPA